MNDKTALKPTLEELTTEQPHRTDADYIAAVNRGLKIAQRQVRDGKTVPAAKAWHKYSLDLSTA